MPNICFRVESGQAGFGLETLIADMAVRCPDRPLSEISIHELPFRTVHMADILIDESGLMLLFRSRCRRLQSLNATCDLLPIADTFLIALKRQRAELFGDMQRCLIAVGLKDLAGAGPKLPGAQGHRWPRQ